MTEKACVVLMRQVCQAMQFVHSNQIIHLDLKPENILCLSREGNRIKIIDFGLARRYDPEKKLQVSGGFTPCKHRAFDCIELENAHCVLCL